MRIGRIALLVLFFLLLCVPAWAGEAIKTLDEAKQAAAATGKLILVDGTADW